MSFMSRKKQFGSLPSRKPNKHRMGALGIAPLVYPADDDAPAEAIAEMREKIRELYNDYRVGMVRQWQERREEAS